MNSGIQECVGQSKKKTNKKQENQNKIRNQKDDKRKH
jgi:hypothetical protein